MIVNGCLTGGFLSTQNQQHAIDRGGNLEKMRVNSRLAVKPGNSMAGKFAKLKKRSKI